MRQSIFQARTVLATSFAGALLFSAAVLVFGGGRRFFYLYYFMPIGIPFIAFLFDRAERWRETPWAQKGLDAAVLALSLLRMLVAVPLISGHSLFLAYALLSARSWPARATAALVLLEVFLIKVFLWRDATLLGGLVVGVLAALLFLAAQSRRRPEAAAVAEA
jgi:hypothetical protein